MRSLICAAAIGVAALGGLAVASSSPQAAVETPKGYAIAEISVNDPEAYKLYVAAVTPLVARFGGVYLVRGGVAVAKEGAPPSGRVVVLEFPSLAAAEAFYESAEYQAILPMRLKSATSRVYYVEGYKP